MDENPPEAKADFFNPYNMECGLKLEAVQALVHMANCFYMENSKNKYADNQTTQITPQKLSKFMWQQASLRGYRAIMYHENDLITNQQPAGLLQGEQMAQFILYNDVEPSSVKNHIEKYYQQMGTDWKGREIEDNLDDLAKELQIPNPDKVRENHCIIKMFALFTYAQKKVTKRAFRIQEVQEQLLIRPGFLCEIVPALLIKAELLKKFPFGKQLQSRPALANILSFYGWAQEAVQLLQKLSHTSRAYLQNATDIVDTFLKYSTVYSQLNILQGRQRGLCSTKRELQQTQIEIYRFKDDRTRIRHIVNNHPAVFYDMVNCFLRKTKVRERKGWAKIIEPFCLDMNVLRIINMTDDRFECKALDSLHSIAYHTQEGFVNDFSKEGINKYNFFCSKLSKDKCTDEYSDIRIRNHFKRMKGEIYAKLSELKILTKFETIEVILDAITVGKRVCKSLKVKYKGQTKPSLGQEPHGSGCIYLNEHLMLNTKICGVWNNGFAVGKFTAYHNNVESFTQNFNGGFPVGKPIYKREGDNDREFFYAFLRIKRVKN